MSSRQTTTHGPGLTVHITTLVAPKEQRHAGHLVWHSTPPQGVQLADLLFRPTGTSLLVHRQRHASLDDTGTDGIDPDASPRQLESHRLCNRYYGRLTRAVVGPTSVRPQTSHTRGPDDTPTWIWLLRIRLLHRKCRVFGAQKNSQGIRPHRLHEPLRRYARKDIRSSTDTGIREHDVEPAICADRFFHHGLHRLFVADVKLPRMHLAGRV